MFTTKAGVRKWDEKVTDKLLDLGYHIDVISDEPCLMNFVFKHDPLVLSCYHDRLTLEIDWIDCDENTDLFLALVALNDETDYMQWFVSSIDDKIWIQHDKKDVSFFDIDTVVFYSDRNEIKTTTYTTREKHLFHKASIQELLEHFKEVHNNK